LDRRIREEERKTPGILSPLLEQRREEPEQTQRAGKNVREEPKRTCDRNPRKHKESGGVCLKRETAHPTGKKEKDNEERSRQNIEDGKGT